MSTNTTPINIGIAPNDGLGDPIRTGGQIINENTTKLFNLSNKTDEGKIHVKKYTGNVDITTVEKNDMISGIVVDGANKFDIKSQYKGVGSITDFGTEAGDFNDGAYFNFDYTQLNEF